MRYQNGGIRRPKASLLSSIFLIGLVVTLYLVLSPRSDAVPQSNTLNVSVAGPRPIAKAISVLEDRCGCPITYEDPRYSYISDVTDVTLEVRRDLNKFAPGKAPKVLVPKSETLSMNYLESSDMGSEAMAVLLRRLLEAHVANGNSGHFRVEVDDRMIHVIPTAIKNEQGNLAAQDSILDTQIVFPSDDRSGMQTLQAFCAALTKATGFKVMVGSAPLNSFMRYHGNHGASGQTARGVLTNLLTNIGDNLSWQLLYDPGLGIYALNVHQVLRTETEPKTEGGISLPSDRSISNPFWKSSRPTLSP